MDELGVRADAQALGASFLCAEQGLACRTTITYVWGKGQPHCVLLQSKERPLLPALALLLCQSELLKTFRRDVFRAASEQTCLNLYLQKNLVSPVF